MATSLFSFQLNQPDPVVCAHMVVTPRLLVDHQRRAKSGGDPTECLNKMEHNIYTIQHRSNKWHNKDWLSQQSPTCIQWPYTLLFKVHNYELRSSSPTQYRQITLSLRVI